MNRARRSTLLIRAALGASALGAAAIASGCGVERAEAPRAGNPPAVQPSAPWHEEDRRPGLPPDPVRCAVVFEESRFRSVRRDRPEALLGYRLQAQPAPIDCIRPSPAGKGLGYERLRGFAALYLYPRIELTGDFESAPAGRGTGARAFYVGYRELAVTDETRRQLLASLALDPASADPAAAIRVMPFEPDFALLATGPRLAVSIEQHAFARSRRSSAALMLSFPAGLPADLASAASAPAFTLYSARAGMDDPMRLLAWSGGEQSDAAVYDVLRELWRRAAALPEVAAAAERRTVLADAATWLRRAGADPAESGAALGELVDHARRGWAPQPAASLRPGEGAALLGMLEFLEVAAPDADVVQLYGESVERLRPFYGGESGKSGEWVEEAVTLSTRPYTIERESWILEAARAILDGSGDPSGARAWQLAKRLSSRINSLAPTSAALVARAADWLSGSDGSRDGPLLAANAALDRAVDYLQRRRLDETKLGQLENSYLRLRSSGLSAADSLARAEAAALGPAR